MKGEGGHTDKVESVKSVPGRTRLFAVIIAVAVIAGATTLGVAYSRGYLTPSPETGGGTTHHFLIIEESTGQDEGMNGSYYRLGQKWPVMHVVKGDTVIINVTNEGTSEPHGFAIVHYDDSGVTVRPGQTQIITFVANQVGNFTVYCNIFCSIHPYMQNGVLIVSPS
jgi:heme/copper-type cytochrome/quinol oxidase subunit 2